MQDNSEFEKWFVVTHLRSLLLSHLRSPWQQKWQQMTSKRFLFCGRFCGQSSGFSQNGLFRSFMRAWWLRTPELRRTARDKIVLQDMEPNFVTCRAAWFRFSAELRRVRRLRDRKKRWQQMPKLSLCCCHLTANATTNATANATTNATANATTNHFSNEFQLRPPK